ncbi:hypothetical protein BC826DRAFT_382411 [Russula brevipes]|nr:hypothetical protein BC826DRAFT_382411 [Russula brevipes]
MTHDHTHTSLNAPIRGRPAVISSSNAIPIAPRHSSFSLSAAPGRPSSPAAQPFHNSQPFGPSMSPKAPLKPSRGLILDTGHPPRQPRSDAAPQATPSMSLGQSMVPKNYPQYHRHQRHPHAPRSLADGRGRGAPIATGAKRKASPPRTEPLVPLEVPPKRSPHLSGQLCHRSDALQCRASTPRFKASRSTALEH